MLARPDLVQQLFYYTKALVSRTPFESTEQSICLFFEPLLTSLKAGDDVSSYPIPSVFAAAHAFLFTLLEDGHREMFLALASYFLSRLNSYVGSAGPSFRMQDACIMSCNFAAIFEYGRKHNNHRRTRGGQVNVYTFDSIHERKCTQAELDGFWDALSPTQLMPTLGWAFRGIRKQRGCASDQQS